MSLSNRFYLMNNTIQNYIWGSHTSMAELFDMNNGNNEPQAELWMGAHPNACSTLVEHGQTLSLSEFIDQDKTAVLGRGASFGELPYLFKVLAANSALSVQVHPSKVEAMEGFAREEAQGIARNAANRNYKDPNHKPELVYALTSYQAMNGFRAFSDIIADFSALDTDVFDKALAAFIAHPDAEHLALFFTYVLTLSGDDKQKALLALTALAHANQSFERFALVVDLQKNYPDDIGAFSPFFLHTITLKPGEAMYLDAGTPHAYVRGTALEIMANSDNVLRAGLTPKFIDVAELVDKTRFEPLAKGEILLAPEQQGCEDCYAIPVPDFTFSILHDPKEVVLTLDSAEIIFAIEGDITLTHDDGDKLTITKGQSVFIPAYLNKYTLTATGRVARAGC